MAERHLGPVEEIHFESEGKSIQAYLVKPPQFDPAKKYPLLLSAALALFVGAFPPPHRLRRLRPPLASRVT